MKGRISHLQNSIFKISLFITCSCTSIVAVKWSFDCSDATSTMPIIWSVSKRGISGRLLSTPSLNFYHCFIQNNHSIAAPLTTSMSSKTPFQWSQSTNAAFQSLKNCFPLSAPFLKVFKFLIQFVVEVGGSDIEEETVLSQGADSDQKLHPCAYFSLHLSPAEKLWHWQQEDAGCYAGSVEIASLAWGDQTAIFGVYRSQEFKIYLVSTRLNSCQVRWAFSFSIEGQPGPRICLTGHRYVSQALRSDFLCWAHTSRLFYDPRIQRTCDILLQYFKWSMLEKDTKEYINACPICNQQKWHIRRLLVSCNLFHCLINHSHTPQLILWQVCLLLRKIGLSLQWLTTFPR